MGEALVSGLIRSGGREPAEIAVTSRREGAYEPRRALPGDEHGIERRGGVGRRPGAHRQAPGHGGALSEIREHVTTDHLVVSFAAGIGPRSSRSTCPTTSRSSA